jgi:hypothetical protein
MRPLFRWIPLLAALLAGCATMTAGSRVERGAQFTHYHTWEWAPGDERPTGDPRLDNNPFFEMHLRSAVERQLAVKGFVRTPLAAPPDLRARYHVNFSKRVEMSGGATSAGACSGNCEPDAYAYEQGTLMVDLMDARRIRSSGVGGRGTTWRALSIISTGWSGRSIAQLPRCLSGSQTYGELASQCLAASYVLIVSTGQLALRTT